MMNEEEFIKVTEYLTKKYVKSNEKQREILKLIEVHGSEGAKGILSEICENSETMNEQDSKKIKELSFYFV